MKSIRSRLLISLLTSVILVLAVGFVSIYYLAERSLHRQFDAELHDELDSLALMGEVEDLSDLDADDLEYNDHGDDTEDAIRFEFAELTLPRYQAQPKSAYYQVWDDSGQVLARSPSLQGKDLAQAPLNTSVVSVRTVTFHDGRSGKMATRRFSPIVEESMKGQPGTEHVLTLAVARSTADLKLAAALLFRVLASSGGLTVLLVAIAILISVRRSLAPLRSLQHDIETIDLDDFSIEFETDSLSDELLPIAECLKLLMKRVESAIKRERRFSSDIAHELRTPVSELRALTEVSMNRANVPAAELISLTDANGIAKHMERIIQSLLQLSRCEAGLIPVENNQIDVKELANAMWNTFDATAQEKQIKFNATVEDNLQLATDPALFASILSNLFSNAVEYTPEGGRIDLNVYAENAHAVVELSNTTDGMAPEDLNYLFDTFWRKDSSRVQSGHLGIGLSLVAAVSEVLGIAVKTALLDAKRFRISLEMPAESV